MDDRDGPHLRNARAADEPLAQATATWIESLPSQVRPVNLSREFPRIANRLCELWKRPAQCEKYFADLLFDRRGTRKGFAPDIAAELGALDSYYESLHPRKHSIWDFTA